MNWFFESKITSLFMWGPGRGRTPQYFKVIFQLHLLCLNFKNPLKCESVICSIMSDSFDPMDCSQPGSSVHGILQARTLGVGYHSLLQGIFLSQGSNPDLLHCRQILYHLNCQGSPPNPLRSIKIKSC